MVNILRFKYSRKRKTTMAIYKCSGCKKYVIAPKCKVKKKKTDYCKKCYEKSDQKKIDAKKSRLKIDMKGKNNPNYRGHTKRVCKCGKIFYKRISPSQIGTRYHIYCSTDCKKKYAKSISNYIKYKNIKFRSSWEVHFAKLCDENNIKWIYEPKAFKSPYGYYTPDFYLPEKDKYIEVKGYFRDDNALLKYKWFKRKYNVMLADKNYFLKNGFVQKKGVLVKRN